MGSGFLSGAIWVTARAKAANFPSVILTLSSASCGTDASTEIGNGPLRHCFAGFDIYVSSDDLNSIKARNYKKGYCRDHRHHHHVIGAGGKSAVISG